jgi:hypothetical protein
LAGSHGDQSGQSFECGATVGAPLDLVFQTAAERLSAIDFIMFKTKPENRQGTYDSSVQFIRHLRSGFHD